MTSIRRAFCTASIFALVLFPQTVSAVVSTPPYTVIPPNTTFQTIDGVLSIFSHGSQAGAVSITKGQDLLRFWIHPKMTVNGVWWPECSVYKYTIGGVSDLMPTSLSSGVSIVRIRYFVFHGDRVAVSVDTIGAHQEVNAQFKAEIEQHQP